MPCLKKSALWLPSLPSTTAYTVISQPTQSPLSIDSNNQLCLMLLVKVPTWSFQTQFLFCPYHCVDMRCEKSCLSQFSMPQQINNIIKGSSWQYYNKNNTTNTRTFKKIRITKHFSNLQQQGDCIDVWTVIHSHWYIRCKKKFCSKWLLGANLQVTFNKVIICVVLLEDESVT